MSGRLLPYLTRQTSSERRSSAAAAALALDEEWPRPGGPGLGLEGGAAPPEAPAWPTVGTGAITATEESYFSKNNDSNSSISRKEMRFVYFFPIVSHKVMKIFQIILEVIK